MDLQSQNCEYEYITGIKNMRLNLILPILIILIYIGIAQAADNTPSLFDWKEGGSEIKLLTPDKPDYEIVFPDNTVQRIDIVIGVDNWQKMLDNMTEMYGEFGNNTQTQKGGDLSLGEHGMIVDGNPVWVPAQVSLNGVTLNNVGIRFKGLSSLSYSWREGTHKISLRLDCNHFDDNYPELKNQNLYGFDELNLQSGLGDYSLIREKVVPDIFRSAGVPAPRTAFYCVYIDTGDGPVYFGLYTMIEAVEDTMITSQFGDGSGNVYKAQGDKYATFEVGKLNTSFFEKETNKKENDYSDLKNLYAALNSDLRISDPPTWRAGLEAVFDVDEFITWLATNTVIQNWDTYGSMAHNFYLYTNPKTGLITWIPWDNSCALMNSSDLGAMATFNRENDSGGNNSTGSSGLDQMGGLITQNHPVFGKVQNMDLTDIGEEWPLIRYLMDDPEYHERYVTTVSKVIKESFNPEKMDKIYTKNHALISPYVIGDEGEQPGYTHLKDPQDFIDSLAKLIDHAYSRYDVGMEYLAEEDVEWIQP